MLDLGLHNTVRLGENKDFLEMSTNNTHCMHFIVICKESLLKFCILKTIFHTLGKSKYTNKKNYLRALHNLRALKLLVKRR